MGHVVSTNGHNGHNGKGTGVDLGLRVEVAKPCCNRLENGGWCSREAGHPGACDAMPRRHGPEESLWNFHRGQIRMCGKAISPSQICRYQRGHHGACENERAL